MITTARQLKDLIRNMSKKKSADAQILMRNYMMERFLERISLSEYKNQFIFQKIISKNTYNVLQFSKNVEKPNDGTTKQGKGLHHE